MAVHPFQSICLGGITPVHPHDLKARPKKAIGDYFAGEELEYEVSFWFLKRVAVAKMSFTPLSEKGRYAAVLKGETVGLAGWLSRYRTDSYRAVMEEVEGGRRLRSIKFEEFVKVGAKVRKNLHHFDHEKRVWVHETTRRNGTMHRFEHKIPEGKRYDDFITASYNFRYQAYGPVEKGRKFVVPTFPRKGASSYEIKMASKEEEEIRRKSENPGADSAFFITLVLDPEVVNSKEGVIEGWLSNDLYPVAGTIKDAVLFGDVKGKLVKRTVISKN